MTELNYLRNATTGGPTNRPSRGPEDDIVQAAIREIANAGGNLGKIECSVRFAVRKAMAIERSAARALER